MPRGSHGGPLVFSLRMAPWEGLEPPTPSSASHFGFPRPRLTEVRGLDSVLALSQGLRPLPSSLYTFPFGLRSAFPVKGSPNLRGSTSEVSLEALRFRSRLVLYPLSYQGAPKRKDTSGFWPESDTMRQQ